MRKTLILAILALLIIQPFMALAQGTNHRFTGQELDAESGLYNFNAREYNPDIGTFIQTDDYLTELMLKGVEPKDPEFQRLLMNPQLLNERSYASNNPVKYVDPEGNTPVTPWDYSTDIFFFNQSLSDYQENKSYGNAMALAADTLGVMLPVIPAGTGGLFKGFIKGLNYLSDLWKENKIVRIFNKAEELKNSRNLANFANIGQLLDNYNKHKSSLNGLSLKQYSKKAQNLYQRFREGSADVLSGFKGEDRVLFDKSSGEFSVITPTNIIKTFFQPTAKDKMQYFLRNIDKINN